MRFLEKDLEQIIHETSPNELVEAGLFLGRKVKRQVRLGNYGVADLIGIDCSGYRTGYDESDKRIIFTICELKQNVVSVSAFLQAVRYAKGLSRWLQKHKPEVWQKHQIRIVLIGKDLPRDSDLVYLPDMMAMYRSIFISLEIYTYDYTLKGLKFKSHSGYKLTNEGF